MATSFQLPVVRNIEVVEGDATTVAVNVGQDLSVFGTYGQDYNIFVFLDHSSPDPPPPIAASVTSAAAGGVAFDVSSSTRLADGGLWVMQLQAPSIEDPILLRRTLAWGRMKVVTPQTISPDSPIYHAVEMVGGDEFTFNVNLNRDITGKSIVAVIYSFADWVSSDGDSADNGQQYRQLQASVISPVTGLLKVTIDEQQSYLCSGTGASWRVTDAGSGKTLLAGPVTAYAASSVPAAPLNPIGSSPAATPTPPNLGSVFL